TTIASTAIIPGNIPPAQISTPGDYPSPRGCRGTFGSFGTAEATRIDADFRGVDCNVTFTGRVTLTKQRGGPDDGSGGGAALFGNGVRRGRLDRRARQVLSHRPRGAAHRARVARDVI